MEEDMHAYRVIPRFKGLNQGLTRTKVEFKELNPGYRIDCFPSGLNVKPRVEPVEPRVQPARNANIL